VYLFALLFIAGAAGLAGFMGRFMTRRSWLHEVRAFALIVMITAGVAIIPEVFSVLRDWASAPNNLSLLVDLTVYELKCLAAAALCAGIGWAMASAVEGLFED
jgi:hypothetical protein